MLHLVDRRAPPRSGVGTDVKVYTNLDEATLVVDGASLGSRRASNHVATWADVKLSPGVHHLTAAGAGGVDDSIEWTVAGADQ